MPFTPSSSSILSSGGAVVASDLTVDDSTLTVDHELNRIGVNTDEPLGTVGVNGDLYFQPTTISTSHVYTDGSLDIRCTDNLKIGTDGADSVKIGRTNTGLVKCHLRSGGENDLVVSDSKIGIGTDTPTSTLDVVGTANITGAVGTGPITTALSSATGILINQDYSDTDAATVVGLDVDLDKTGASTSNNTIVGVNVDIDNTTPTGGDNTMTGIKVTPTCTQVSGSGGTFSVKGLEVVATGSTAPEQSTVRALDLIATGGDYTQGILIETDDANGWDMKILSSATVADFCTIKTVANGATTIETVDGSGADADLTFTVDGSFDVTATSASFAADVSIAEAKHINIAAPSLPTTDHTSTGLTAQMLAGGAIGAFQTVCIHTVANEVVVSDANAAATMPVIGICTAAAISDTATGTILLQGFIRDDSWNWTVGGIVYASETAGELTQTAPTTSGALVQALGVALSGDVVYFSPGSVTTVEVA